MGGSYIGIHLKTDHATPVKDAAVQVFADAGFRLLGDVPASVAVEDEEKLPEGDRWYGAIVSGPTRRGWVSIYVDDWADSGLLAQSLCRNLDIPTLEVWVVEDTHWGYTYYEAGEVRDRFADDPAPLLAPGEEAALYRGNAPALSAILQVPPEQFAKTLQEARTGAGQFAGGPLDAIASAVGLPFEHLFTGYDYFFEDDPDDYSRDLENWSQFRHLAFQLPRGRETLAL